MIPKSIQLPKPKFKTIEEAQEWAESFCSFFERFYNELYNDSFESTKIAVRGNDNREIHGFFASKDDME